MTGLDAILTGRVAAALALLLALSCPVALAQQPAPPPPAQHLQGPPSSLLSSQPSAGLGSPGSSLLSPGPTLFPPPHAGPPPSTYIAPMVPAGQTALVLGARFGPQAPAITSGLVWRIYAAKPDSKGGYRLVKEETTPTPTIVLPVGSYVVHVSFGLATAVKTVQLSGETVHQVFDLPAGGVRLMGKVGDVAIPAGQISFDIFPGSQFDIGDRRPVAERVLTGDVVVVPEGTYFIVSNYGDGNATVRSDIRVQANRLTDVTVNHRAAVITLKLVAGRGGEALPSTAWSVLTPGGDVIKESIGAFPRVVLAEGEYRAIARNEGRVYERDFKVVAGVDGDVEVVAR
jgi:hypothetical protein